MNNGKCPQCNGNLWRDEVDIGVGVQYGPWRCEDCAWYEGHEADAATDAEADALWNEVAAAYRKEKGFAPLTPEQAQKAYDEAVPIPLSPERIEEIVDYATREEPS